MKVKEQLATRWHSMPRSTSVSKPGLIQPRTGEPGSVPPHSMLCAVDEESSATSRSRNEPQTPSPTRFSVVRYPERFPEILELRRVAYNASQKFGPDTAETAEPEETDPRNLRSSTVIAEEAGQIIGSLRLTPPLPGPILHHTCQFSRPLKGLPPRSEFIEASWACVHPDHRGKGLFWDLAAYTVLTAQQLGMSYLVGGTDASMWPNWRRCGFRKTGTTYKGALSGNEYWVMLLNLETVLAGRNIAPQFARVLLPLARAQAVGR